MMLLPDCGCCGGDCPCYNRCKYDWVVTYSDGFTHETPNSSCLGTDSWTRQTTDPGDCTAGYSWFNTGFYGDGGWRTTGNNFLGASDVHGPAQYTAKSAAGAHWPAGSSSTLYLDRVSAIIDVQASILCNYVPGGEATYSLRVGAGINASNTRIIRDGSQQTVAEYTWLKRIVCPLQVFSLQSTCQTKTNADCLGRNYKAMYLDLATNPIAIQFTAAGVSLNGTTVIQPSVTGEEKPSGSAANCYLRYLENISIVLTLKERQSCVSNPLP